ncbi:glycosyltransferase 87 family protein [Streptomyces sp. NBC_00513]|uniref:glycosyltransferase 87 family protein n=1 Tax=unclassified Streptomyces TaxID=2593676 RepID=UPI002253FEEF|nr:glycosyltransferase 87 family protein [Streptomyces sp. NBC_00424]MCX5072209.1 glycosyltransferase 87 family protein [Streptomyces sp. NBC_00424]WUD44434.1 glycosyltransferase 87 family protein [Streptomyces sp. NBC_00513]
MNPRTALASAALAALVTALVLTVRYDGVFTDPVGLFARYAVCWLLFAAALVALRRVRADHVVPLVLAGAVAVTVTGLVAAPRTSTDSYRYAWDGRVQSAGIPPYDHAPRDPALARLRDPWLFPTGAACTGPDLVPLPHAGAAPHCTRINRPGVHTIYPPVAEAYFLAVDRLSPQGARHKAFQVGGALISLGVTGALLAILRRGGGDLRRAAYWAWCPAVAVEAVNNAHVDVLGTLLAVVGLGLVASRAAGRRAGGGVLLGAAVATKLLPAIVLPGALSGVRRIRDAAVVLLPAAAFTALSYLPYLLLSHGSVLGYLGGYVQEEGYEDPASGSRYSLLRLVLPDGWALPVLLVAVAGVCVHVMWRGDPRRPWSGALTVVGWSFALLTPGYSWYALLLIALVALDGRWEWLGVALAGAAVYVLAPVFGHAAALSNVAYGAAVALVLAVTLLRRRTSVAAGQGLPSPVRGGDGRRRP